MKLWVGGQLSSSFIKVFDSFDLLFMLRRKLGGKETLLAPEFSSPRPRVFSSPDCTCCVSPEKDTAQMDTELTTIT
jgi:hypothetical protein